MRRLSLLGVSAILLVGTAAHAQDLSPRIDHLPVAGATRGSAVEVRALIASPAGHAIFEPAVFVRLPGLPRFTRLAMQPDPQIKDLFAATIPVSIVTADFDYYLEAFDDQGNGPGRAGSPERPFRVAVSAAPVAAAPAVDRSVQIMLTAPPPEPRSHGLTGTLALLGGLATSAGLGAGWIVKIQADDFEAARRSGSTFAYDRYQEGQSMTLLANIPLAVGGMLLTGALVSALWPEDEAFDRAPAPPPPAADTGGAP